MIKVTSEVKMNRVAIARITRAQTTALEQTVEALHADVQQAQVMPRDTGHLQNESTYVDYENASSGSVQLVTDTPYARRLYFHPEYNFRTVENPNAQGEWYKDYLKGGAKQAFCTEAFAILMKRLGGL